MDQQKGMIMTVDTNQVREDAAKSFVKDLYLIPHYQFDKEYTNIEVMYDLMNGSSELLYALVEMAKESVKAGLPSAIKFDEALKKVAAGSWVGGDAVHKAYEDDMEEAYYRSRRIA